MIKNCSAEARLNEGFYFLWEYIYRTVVSHRVTVPGFQPWFTIDLLTMQIIQCKKKKTKLRLKLSLKSSKQRRYECSSGLWIWSGSAVACVCAANQSFTVHVSIISYLSLAPQGLLQRTARKDARARWEKTHTQTHTVCICIVYPCLEVWGRQRGI